MLAGARVDDHDVLAQSPGAIMNGPSGDGGPPVRGQLKRLLIQGPAGLGGQVARVGHRPGRGCAGGPRPAPGVLGGQHIVDEKPLLVRAEIVIPVPDQG